MKLSRVTIVVRNGDINQALKVFKKKVATSGHLEELKQRKEYVKPTTKRRLIKQKALRRNELEVIRNREMAKW